MNLTLPAADTKPSELWPHFDQSPDRKGMQSVQDILNLTPNGPEDGGLMVVKGSHKLSELFFKTHPEVTWFESEGRDCELLRVCAQPGDLIFRDSQTIRYNKAPSS